MTEGWAYGGAPQQHVVGGVVTLVEGVAFVLSGRSGDIAAGGEQGLFFRDTRFLSRLALTIDGQTPEPLTVERPRPYTALFVARRPPRAGTADSTLVVIRRRFVGSGMFEQITLRNVGRETAGVDLRIELDADFAGLFEVKEGRARRREGIEVAVEPSTVLWQVTSAESRRGVRVSADSDAIATPGAIGWRLAVPPREDMTVSLTVAPSIDGTEVVPPYAPGAPAELSAAAEQFERWQRVVPVATTPDERFARLLATGSDDVGTLRIDDAAHPGRVVVAAGAPWFMTVFGRDSLLTSWMLLPVDPGIALGTLRTLAELQGEKVDPLTEEEPGRILHEVRSGLDTSPMRGGGSVYYGSIDSSPLFVMLLGELRRWGLARADVDELLPHADRALAWIEDYGDRDGDGFVEYQRATDRGLVNQGWKDSFDAINFASGELAEPPIALAEVQGYVYAAYLARSHFAREAGDEAEAARWAGKAGHLKRSFNERFWLADRGHFAVALDGHKRPVDAVASNIGHCLWTGIVDEDKATLVADRLLSDDMFTGFGVRTLAASMGAYNPVSYHNGSVWPHDNALLVAGLMRYGCLEQAQRVVLGLLDAAERMDGRLPELFSGFDRSEFDSPVPYPTACSPQAWSAASPLLMLRTLLRFDPWVPFGRVWCAPAVPPAMLPLRVDRLQLAGSTVAITVDTDGWHLDGLPDEIELMEAPRRPLTAATPSWLTPGAEQELRQL